MATKLTQEMVIDFILSLPADSTPDGPRVWVTQSDIDSSPMAGCDLDELVSRLRDLEEDKYISIQKICVDPHDNGRFKQTPIILRSKILDYKRVD